MLNNFMYHDNFKRIFPFTDLITCNKYWSKSEWYLYFKFSFYFQSHTICVKSKE